MTTSTFMHRIIVCTTTTIAAAAALAACSSGGGAGTGGGPASTAGTGGHAPTSSAATGMGGGSGAGGGMTCPPSMKYGGGETKTVGGSVTAKIVDETGAAVAGQPVYICGIDICSNPGMTGSDGSVAISTTLMEKKPAFKYGDALTYAELAIPLTMATTDFTAGGSQVLATGKLSNKPGAALTPGSDAISGDVTISIPAGASVGINMLTYGTADQQKFRAVNIPLTNVGPVLDPVTVGDAGAGFALLYGVAPAETTICPAAKVTVALPSSIGWAPGTNVEFWIMTTDVGQTYAPYAGWAKMSDGVVSSDGASVSTVDGQGFIFLENFAIRKAD